MFIIGITGGIGSGKSSFAHLLNEAGLPVLDADQISHEVTAPGGPSIPKIREAFGSEFIREDGSLDRKLMASLVFRDRKALDHLSAIIHRDVFASIDDLQAALIAEKQPALVLDVPIPVEYGFLDRVDLVACIWAADEIRIARLKERGMSEAEAKRRISVQMNEEEYRGISDYFILNNGSKQELRQKAEAFLEDVLGNRGIKFQKLI